MAILAAWLEGTIDARALPSIFILGSSCAALENRRYRKGVRLAATAVFVLTASAMAAHRLPGFDNFAVLNEARISPDGVPYSLYLNFDKALIGVFLLGFGPYLSGGKRGLGQSLALTGAVTGATAAVLLPASVLSGYVAYDFKLSSHLPAWMFANLFITCVSEEAFFRGLIQTNLQNLLGGHAAAKTVGLAVASVLFGLAHYAGGPAYVILAALAGVGYGMSYQFTGRMEAAIWTHFSVNLLHFVFFTYPALAPESP